MGIVSWNAALSPNLSGFGGATLFEKQQNMLVADVHGREPFVAEQGLETHYVAIEFLRLIEVLYVQGSLENTIKRRPLHDYLSSNILRVLVKRPSGPSARNRYR